jgi:protein gp37
VKLVPEHLGDPLRWQRPRMIFVNSMSDLFFEPLSFEYIAAVFGVMMMSPTHTFQVLTKRPERAIEFFAWLEDQARERDAYDHGEARQFVLRSAVQKFLPDDTSKTVWKRVDNAPTVPWPLRNVWVGVSAENQKTADERIPLLLRCSAAVRWVSYEPGLGAIDFDLPRCEQHDRENIVFAKDGTPWCVECDSEASYGHWLDPLNGGLGWIVVGGESQTGARPFDLAWARSTVQQCREASVACFVKQMGSKPFVSMTSQHPQLPKLNDRAGADPSEWPADLRVCEYPNVP